MKQEIEKVIPFEEFIDKNKCSALEYKHINIISASQAIEIKSQSLVRISKYFNLADTLQLIQTFIYDVIKVKQLSQFSEFEVENGDIMDGISLLIFKENKTLSVIDLKICFDRMKFAKCYGKFQIDVFQEIADKYKIEKQSAVATKVKKREEKAEITIKSEDVPRSCRNIHLLIENAKKAEKEDKSKHTVKRTNKFI